MLLTFWSVAIYYDHYAVWLLVFLAVVVGSAQSQSVWGRLRAMLAGETCALRPGVLDHGVLERMLADRPPNASASCTVRLRPSMLIHFPHLAGGRAG